MAVNDDLQRLKTVEGQAQDIAYEELLVSDPDFSRRYVENLRNLTCADLVRTVRQRNSRGENRSPQRDPPAGA